ncbi:MAG: adenylyl-sulfate kinase [Gammaproteobacteria bacterium]|nr:adenylyl-sulfate kinase [Gammaproteobacteria bacterium]
MSSNVVWHNATVTRARRETLNGHRGVAIWFTGLSGAGKSTIAHSVEERLHQAGCRTIVLDGDNVRHGLCSDLGFSTLDRTENIRRISETVKLFVDAGVIVLTAFISPQRADRLRARETLGVADFIEVYCRCSLAECERRDVKGLYKRARAGEIKDFTGISAPYDEPELPDVTLDTQALSVEQCVEHVVQNLVMRGVLPGGRV